MESARGADSMASRYCFLCGLGEVATAPKGPRVVVERVLQARQRRLLELAHPLARQLEHASDLLERQAFLAVEPEPELEDTPLRFLDTCSKVASTCSGQWTASKAARPAGRP